MRSFNYTDRKRIFRDDFLISLEEKKEGIGLEITFPQFIELGYAIDSKVRVEAYNRNTYMRFECGIVKDIKGCQNFLLSDFDDKESVLLRIKVVSNKGSKLEGLADRIRPSKDGQNGDSIINVRPAELHGGVWSVEFNDEENPTVLIDTSIGKDRLTSDPIFSGLILPAVFREVLVRILLIENDSVIIDYESTETGVDWRMDWLSFCKQSTKKSLTQDELKSMGEQEKYEWIDDVVAVFGRNNKLSTNLVAALGEDA